jgi:hypothetical protein
MARQPASPPADDPGAERVTLTRDEIAALVAQGIAQHAATAQAVRTRTVSRDHLPTLDEAKAQAEALVADGVPPVGIETRDGWYVHPLVGCNVDQVEAHLVKKAKKAAGKKALADADQG